MENEFDLDKLGKRMPYSAPEGFMDDMEQQVWAQIDADKAQQQRPKRNWWYAMAGGLIAASIALLIILNVVPSTRQQVASMEGVEQAFASLSDADQEYLMDVYQEELFIDDIDE